MLQWKSVRADCRVFVPLLHNVSDNITKSFEQGQPDSINNIKSLQWVSSLLDRLHINATCNINGLPHTAGNVSMIWEKNVWSQAAIWRAEGLTASLSQTDPDMVTSRARGEKRRDFFWKEELGSNIQQPLIYLSCDLCSTHPPRSSPLHSSLSTLTQHFTQSCHASLCSTGRLSASPKSW